MNFRAGAATTCITPPLGTLINGELTLRRARRIHDDLFVRALVLDDGGVRLAFAVVDACVVDRPLFDEAKRLVEQRTGMPPHAVMMCCTHTHSGGSACGVHLTEADQPYRAALPDRIAEAVQQAADRLAPARLAWGSGSVPQHVFCRRLHIREGMTYVNQLGLAGDRAKMNWDSPHPADGEPCGPVDPELFLLAVEHADGRPLAVLANYALHYVGDVADGDVSADYFGLFAERLEQLLGVAGQNPPFVALLCNGTSGDVNNIDPRTPQPQQPPYARIRRVAEDVAQEALRIIRRLPPRREVRLAAALRECVAAVRRPGAEELEQARQVLAGRSVDQLRFWPENYAREQLLLAEYPPALSLPMQVFRMGELAVAGWPGEIFAATGLDLKRRSGGRPLLNVGLANGWFGYIPPPEQFALGAYETWRMRTCPLEVDAASKMTSTLLEMLEQTD